MHNELCEQSRLRWRSARWRRWVGRKRITQHCILRSQDSSTWRRALSKGELWICGSQITLSVSEEISGNVMSGWHFQDTRLGSLVSRRESISRRESLVIRKLNVTNKRTWIVQNWQEKLRLTFWTEWLEIHEFLKESYYQWHRDRWNWGIIDFCISIHVCVSLTRSVAIAARSVSWSCVKINYVTDTNIWWWFRLSVRVTGSKYLTRSVVTSTVSSANAVRERWRMILIMT